MATLRKEADTHELDATTAPPTLRRAAAKTPAVLAEERERRRVERQERSERVSRLRAELEAGRERYAVLWEASLLAYLALDPDGRIVEANTAALALFGIDRAVLLQKPLSAFMDAGDAAAFRRFREEVVADGSRRSGELMIRGSTRTPRKVSLTVSFASRRRRGSGEAHVCVLNEKASRPDEAPKDVAQPPHDWSELLRGIVSATSLALDGNAPAEHVRALVARARDLALRGLTIQVEAPPTTSARRLRGTVLIVEDDPLVRSALRDQLLEVGLVVVEAPDGEHATKLFERTTPDLVVTHVRVPDATGHEIVARMRARRPELPVLFLSDGAPDPDDAPAASARTRLLVRPHAPEALVDEVEALLAPPRRPSRPSQRIAAPAAPTAKIRRRQADGTTSDFAIRGYSPGAVARQVMRALEDAEQERGRGIWSSVDPEVWIGDTFVGRLSPHGDASRIADAVLAHLEAQVRGRGA